MTAKELLRNIKAAFAEPAAPASEPVTTDVPAGVDVTLADGKVMTCTPAQEVGADCSIDGAPAPDGEHALPDGSAIVCEGGKIKEIKPAVPAAPAPEQSMAAAFELTPENVQAMYAQFATGTPEERIANLEIMCKALMEYSFGWQLREAQEKASRESALATYKESLTSTQTVVEQQASQLQAASQKLEKQDEVIKGLFELAEKLTEVPTADPQTLNPAKREAFERTEKREKKIESIAAAIKEMRSK